MDEQHDPGNLVVVFAAVLPHMTVATDRGPRAVNLVCRFRVRDRNAAVRAFMKLLHRYDVDAVSVDTVLRDLDGLVRKAVEGGRPAETAQELDEDWTQGPLLADGLIAPVDPVEHLESLAKLQANMMEKAAKQKLLDKHYPGGFSKAIVDAANAGMPVPPVGGSNSSTECQPQSVNGPLSTAEFFKQFFPGVAVDPEQAAAADSAIEAGMLSFHDLGLPLHPLSSGKHPTAADVAKWKHHVLSDQAGESVKKTLSDYNRRQSDRHRYESDNPCGLDPWPPPWV